MIYENENEKKVMMGLLDLALKSSGLTNLELVNAMGKNLKSVKEWQKLNEKPEKKPKRTGVGKKEK